jgi:hypothetical protein
LYSGNFRGNGKITGMIKVPEDSELEFAFYDDVSI